MATLSAQEVRDCAVKLQDDFLRAHSANPEMDQRDIYTVRNSISYVEKFVRHNQGSLEKAFRHMVEALTWRKSFGVNDIRYEDIDDSLWGSGMAMNHGYDATGQNVVILCIAKHRKDSKKANMLRKWIAFCYEMHQKVYPNNKMCMVFDMTGAGLSNMDMELVRFVVNCFKIYFPDLLQNLLVYNMPWVLQAAWKIVQSWLSEGAASKVKFVTQDNIQEFIPAHNLLVRYGGTDTWEFDHEVEKEVMLRQIREVLGETQLGAPGPDDEMLDMSEEMSLEGLGSNGSAAHHNGANGTMEDGLKHVRFSSSIPPSRQSRYGTESEQESLSSTGSHDQAVLKKGSATSSGFRRRQVTRLMSLQEDPRESVSSLERTGSLPVNILERPGVGVGGGGVVTVGDVTVSPSNELVFSGQKDTDVYCTLTLKNVSENSVAYKIKTTAPNRYKVRPNLALINPRSVAKVQVMLVQGSEIVAAQDKFLVQTHTFTDQRSIPSSTELARYWRALPAPAVREHRMRCRRQTDIPSRSGIKDAQKGKAAVPNGGVGRPGASPLSKPAPGSSMLESGDDLHRTVRQLLQANEKLSLSVNHLQRLSYATIGILLLLLLTVILY